jgi:diguanylate cyclase (GGDEF)-like protein/PAS domain S-box-containing protein
MRETPGAGKSHVVVFAVVACLSLVGLDLRQIWMARSEQLAQAGREMTNLSALLAQHARGVVEAAGGGFTGVVLPTEQFQKFYAGVDIGPYGAITLLRDDGAIVVRQPRDPRDLGRGVANGDAIHQTQTNMDGKSFAFVSVVDGMWRIGSGRRVGDSHLLILVSRARSDILAGWWHEAQINLACLSLVSIIVLILGNRMGRQIAERIQAEKLYRLLADNSEDAILCIGIDGVTQFLSPSFYAMTRWEPGALAGQHWWDIVPPADRAILQDAIGELAAGTAQVAGRYRCLSADGQTIWVEMRARLVRQEEDRPRTIVANIRDITQQKLAEEALEEANAELSAMSVTDALTGISNRRFFDQMLRKEWNRAMRTASPVALLMIDVDHFKAYNDLYGHQMGDQCLRLMAQAISRSVLRAGDLVTRYGGEEFAVILPDTIAEKAAQVGERVLDTLRHHTITHRGTPSGIVSVSIGVASIIPELNSNAADLVDQADAALYQAKHAGRAQVAVAPPVVLPVAQPSDHSRSAA